MFYERLDILKITANATVEGILVADDKEKIVFANNAIEKYFGYQPKEIVNSTLDILIPEKFRIPHKNHFDAFINDPAYLKNTNYREVFGLHKSGEKIPLEIRLSFFEHENCKYVLALIFDNTFRHEREKKSFLEKKELEAKVKDNSKELELTIKQLRKTNKLLEDEINKKIVAKEEVRKALMVERELNQLKTRFLSLVSHEFRTPLSGIMTSTSLIKKYTAQNDTGNIYKHVEIIHKMIRNLTSILDDFLVLDNIESGDIQYKFSFFECKEVVQEIVTETKTLLKKGQKIEISACEKPVQLYQDKKIFHIIISNLIYNAIKYSDENTCIILSVSSDEKNIIFKIQDHGIGIPENEQKYLFQRFFRASNVGNIQGTGIGLNIIKINIENLGGSIYFESKENNGTTFYVKLPTNIKSKVDLI